jgi:hypothetical protein
MRVNPDDGCCLECGGTLDVIDADESTMTVQCRDCHARETVAGNAVASSRVRSSRISRKRGEATGRVERWGRRRRHGQRDVFTSGSSSAESSK